MLRQASRLCRRPLFATLSRRRLCTEVAASSGDSALEESWRKSIPNIDPPKIPSNFMHFGHAAPSSFPSKITLNFVLPYASQLSSKQVDMVIIPAITGYLGVLAGHVPTIAELKPQILSVCKGNEVTKCSVSSGFASIHANSVADEIAVKAFPIDHIDQSLVQKGLTEFTQKLTSATTDLEKAEAQIVIDVHSAINS